MKKPVLLIMAAGMGSRYGGLKQMDPIDQSGHLIIDYSLYDAMLAGFEEVVFVIRRENESLFKEMIGDRISQKMQVHYVYQELSDLPDEFEVPEGRVKPWGTGHAVLSAIYTIGEAPFAVINADDYYGREGFRLIYDFLSREQTRDEKYHFAMVGYEAGKTVTENGAVARGVCKVDAEGYLTEIRERTHIEKRGDDAAYTTDHGKTWTTLKGDTPVSMNFWGFTFEMADELQTRFSRFLENEVPKNPQKAEYFLPFVVEELLKEEKADVLVLQTKERWYGVTYQEDKAAVVKAIAGMREQYHFM